MRLALVTWIFGAALLGLVATFAYLLWKSSALSPDAAFIFTVLLVMAWSIDKKLDAIHQDIKNRQ